MAKKRQTAADYLALAREHLERVRVAWTEPTDWSDLSLYGFYCLEAAVLAAAQHTGIGVKHAHSDKAQAAATLTQRHSLPDISDLLVHLNEARKAAAYGDLEFPSLDAGQVATEIEEYVDAVARLLES